MNWISKISVMIIAMVVLGYFLVKGLTPPMGSAENSSDCEDIIFENNSFTQCIADPKKHEISMHVTGNNGIIYRGFAKLAKDVPPQSISFAVNAGMFDKRSRPIGYYVEEGQRLYKINNEDDAGNFYLKPNGIFFGSGDKWQVMSTDKYSKTIKKRPEFGTQSGPMLLINGAFHPKITSNGQSRKIRNAVGVDAKGRAHFIISNDPVSFGKITRLMRDYVKTKNALFLDGTVSALWHPSSARMDDAYLLGPLIVVAPKTGENIS